MGYHAQRVVLRAAGLTLTNRLRATPSPWDIKQGRDAPTHWLRTGQTVLSLVLVSTLSVLVPSRPLHTP